MDGLLFWFGQAYMQSMSSSTQHQEESTTTAFSGGNCKVPKDKGRGHAGSSRSLWQGHWCRGPGRLWIVVIVWKEGPREIREKNLLQNLDSMNQRIEWKLGFSYFIHIHICYRLHGFGGGSGIYTARVLNPTFHWLFRQHKDHSFLQVLAQEAHMVIMSRAFVFLNYDIGT